MGILDGKVAVITGGTRGLGLGLAKKFIAEGAKVVIGSRSQNSVDEALQQLLLLDGQAAAGMALEVADLQQVQTFYRFALNAFGKVDIWINNAGITTPYGPSLAYSPEKFYRVIQTNILGVYHGSRVAMDHFIKQKSGKLINMLGMGSEKPAPFQSAYGSSKTWVRNFTLALAEETKEQGVGVFAFNPGMVLTDLLTDVEVIRGYEDRLKIFPKIVRILAKPPEVPARKAAWIASSATDGRTGRVYSLISPWSFPVGALREWLRPKKEGEDDGFIKIRVIPGDEDLKQ